MTFVMTSIPMDAESLIENVRESGLDTSAPFAEVVRAYLARDPDWQYFSPTRYYASEAEALADQYPGPELDFPST